MAAAHLVAFNVDMTSYVNQPNYSGWSFIIGCTMGEGSPVHAYRLMRAGAYQLYAPDSFGSATGGGGRAPAAMLHISNSGQLSLDPPGQAFEIRNGTTVAPLLGHARIGRGTYTGQLCGLAHSPSGPPSNPFRCAPPGEDLELVLMRERNYYIGSASAVLLVRSNGTCSVSSLQVGGATLPVTCGLTPPPPTLPAAPAGLTAVARSTTRVELAWTDLSTNESSFQIERKLSTATTFQSVGSAPQGTATFSDANVASGATYNYRVRAVNSAGSSAPSNVATVTLAAPPTPTGLTGQQSGPGRVNLSWSDVVSESGYVLFRAAPGGPFAQIASLGANATTFSDAEAIEGSANLYRIGAFNALGTSPPSDPPLSVMVSAPVPCGGAGPPCPDPALTQFNHNQTRIDYRLEPQPLVNLDRGLLGRGLWADGSNGEVMIRPPTETCVGSRVDDLRWSFSQESVDFTTGPDAANCPTCGCGPVNAATGKPPQLQLRRYHRPRQEHVVSSFGPGVFSNFDMRITFYSQGIDGHLNAVLFDPTTEAPPVTFFERSAEDGDALDDGVLHDKETRVWRSMSLYRYTGQWEQVSNPADATAIFLYRNDGTQMTFEPIAPNVGNPGQIEARPLYYYDRNGYWTAVGYEFARDATNQQLGFDRTQLWKISSVADGAHHDRIDFAYQRRSGTGRWLVTTATTFLDDGTPRVYTYGYSDTGGAADTLASVKYPDGNSSTFSKTFDSATQLWGLTYDDIGAGTRSLKKTVWVTGPTFRTSDGTVHGQTPNLVRRVVNAGGEEVLRLQENPNDPRDAFVIEAGRMLTRIKTDARGAPREVLRARAVTANPATATYDLLSSYVADDKGVITQTTDALGKTRQLQREGQSRRITGLVARDGTSASWQYHETGQPTRQVDRAGAVTDTVYDDGGNVRSVTQAAGTAQQAVTQFTVDGVGRVTAKRDPLGRVTTYSYANNRGYLASVTEPPDLAGGAPAVTRFENGPFGVLLAKVDPAGRRITYQYDLRNRRIGTTFPDGTRETTAYGAGSLSDLVVTETNRNGVTTTYEYDASKRLKKIVRAANKPEKVEEVFEYLPGTELVSAATVAGERTEYTYDSRNRESSRRRYANNTRVLVSQLEYDAADRVTGETDPYGRKTHRLYDSIGRVIRRVSELVPGGVPAGASLASLVRLTTANPAYVIEDTTYDGMDRVLSRTNGRGIRTTYGYDAQGRQVQQIEAAGTTVARTTQFEYDLAGNRTRTIHPRTFKEGRPFHTVDTFTGRDLLASRTRGAGTDEAATTSYTYTATKKLATVTDPRGGVTAFTYDSNDRTATMRDAAGFTVSYGYDAVGNLLSTANGLNQATTSTVDGHNRRLTERNPAGQTSTVQYDDNLTDGAGLDLTYQSQVSPLGFGAKANGRATLRKNPAGDATLTVEDGLLRSVLTLDPNNNVTKVAYDTVVSGLLETASTNGAGNISRFRRDALQGERTTVDQAGKITTRTFDSAGNRLAMRDPNGVGDDCLYDELDRRVSCTDTRGDRTLQELDAADNLVAQVDGLGGRSTCLFDTLDRRTSCTDRNGSTSAWAYDRNDNVTTFTDPQGGVTSYTYDPRNLVTSTTFPDSTGATDKLTFTHEGAGRLASKKLQNGDVISFTYDPAGRLTQRTYPDGANDTLTYDAASRLKTAASARYGTNVALTYDAGGRTTKDSITFQGTTRSISATYDAANRLTRLTYPDGSTVNRTFTNRDQLASLTRGTQAIASYAYDDGGRSTSVTLGNGLVETRTFRTDDLATGIDTPGVGNFSYTYDAGKRKLTEGGTAVAPQTFAYDPEGRLTNWSDGSNNQSWVLSAAGDWTSFTRNGTTQSRVHNACHELTNLGSAALTHDSRGNLTTDDRGQKLTFDYESRLQKFVKTSGGSTTTITYFYDALGRKVAKTVGSNTTVFVPFASDTFAEYLNGTLDVSYLLGPGTDNHLALVKSGAIRWFTRNHLGSVTAVTDSARAIKERYRYTAYGERTILSPSGSTLSASAVNNQVGFTGRYHDKDTGLIDHRARQYDPKLGRFVSRDDRYRDGPNLYQAYHVPNATDPSGRAASLGGSALRTMSGPSDGIERRPDSRTGLAGRTSCGGNGGIDYADNVPVKGGPDGCGECQTTEHAGDNVVGSDGCTYATTLVVTICQNGACDKKEVKQGGLISCPTPIPQPDPEPEPTPTPAPPPSPPVVMPPPPPEPEPRSMCEKSNDTCRENARKKWTTCVRNESNEWQRAYERCSAPVDHRSLVVRSISGLNTLLCYAWDHISFESEGNFGAGAPDFGTWRIGHEDCDTKEERALEACRIRNIECLLMSMNR